MFGHGRVLRQGEGAVWVLLISLSEHIRWVVRDVRIAGGGAVVVLHQSGMLCWMHRWQPHGTNDQDGRQALQVAFVLVLHQDKQVVRNAMHISLMQHQTTVGGMPA